jgi:hypothetical protein
MKSVQSTLLLFTAVFALANAASLTQTLFWTGGWCGICEGSDYACFSGVGDWNSGERTFVDPIPAGNLVTSITAEIFGVFGCEDHMVKRRYKFLIYLGNAG